MKFEIPDFCLVMLLGPAGGGQLSFLEKYFAPNERISPSLFAAMISDAPEEAAAEDAYSVMLKVLDLRLKHRQLACVYAPFLTTEETMTIRKMAKKYHCQLVAIAFETSLETCLSNSSQTREAHVPSHIIRSQHAQMAALAPFLADQGYRKSIRLQNTDEIESLEILRKKLRCDQKQESGPFDIVGDVHGCLDELLLLLQQLDYHIAQKADTADPWQSYSARHPENRRLVFVGDFCDLLRFECPSRRTNHTSEHLVHHCR